MVRCAFLGVTSQMQRISIVTSQLQLRAANLPTEVQGKSQTFDTSRRDTSHPARGQVSLSSDIRSSLPRPSVPQDRRTTDDGATGMQAPRGPSTQIPIRERGARGPTVCMQLPAPAQLPQHPSVAPVKGRLGTAQAGRRAGASCFCAAGFSRLAPGAAVLYEPRLTEAARIDLRPAVAGNGALGPARFSRPMSGHSS